MTKAVYLQRRPELYARDRVCACGQEDAWCYGALRGIGQVGDLELHEVRQESMNAILLYYFRCACRCVEHCRMSVLAVR